ncbi:MAG: 50S ribosomal protein L10 [Acidobacteriota bacterium]|nr:50S ribosomal protein L10 [Acidobacteriota bacterium]
MKVRPDKVATVDEVKARVASTSTAVVTEYRGMTVAQISTLRRQLRALGADYKVFKNTLVRRAVSGTAVEPISEFLDGPTAIAFVDGDVSAVAKALRDYSKVSPNLIVKGGVLGGKSLSKTDLTALADLPSREVLLAQFAGLLASPLRTMAGLLKALPQNFAYGLSALVDARGGSPVPATETAAAETPAGVEDAVSASDDVAALEPDAAAPEEAPAAEPVAETTEEAPAAETVAETPEASAEASAEPAE